VIGAMLVTSAPVSDWRNAADEGSYLRYAERIATGGIGAFPALVREFLTDPALTVNAPAPLRLTGVLPAAMAVHWFGPTYRSLQHVSLVAFLALLVVVFVAMRRMPGRHTAAAVALLVAVSPLELAMARRALFDSVNVLCWTTSLFLCIEAIAGQWRRGWLVVGLPIAATLLVKEPNVLLVAVALALVGVDAACRRRLPSPWAVAGIVALPTLLAGLAVVAAAGGLSQTIAVVHTIVSRGANPYLLRHGGGPWYRYVVDLVLISPWTTLLYLVWLGILVGEGRWDARLLGWALVPPLLVALLAIATPDAVFVRYAMPADVPIRLGAVLGLGRLVGDRPGDRRAGVRFAVALAALLAVEVRSFRHLFVTHGIYDPSSLLLLQSHGLLGR
jgi:4-amino-4-deoxy-L-arabinose transferase-like glycosyltransferase